MNDLTHAGARRLIDADLDGLLQDGERLALQAHLQSCDSCRTYADEMHGLASDLMNEFHARLDGNPGPSGQVSYRIISKARSIAPANRVAYGSRLTAGFTLLILLALAFSFAIRKLGPRSMPGAALTNPISSGPTPAASNHRLIAFAAEKGQRASRNLDIYTMHMDGSHVTNLTNNPANDSSPAWSPDGKKIAFTSDRTGNEDIYAMNVDGSGLMQLTDNKGYDGSLFWSPDGSRIVYLSSPRDPNSDGSRVTAMNSDGSNKTTLTPAISFYSILGSSPDGRKVIYQENKLDPNGSSSGISVHSVNMDGADQRQLFSGGGVTSLRWEDTGHFSGIVMTQADNAYWYLYRFNTDGTPAEKLGSSPTPINGWFTEGERTVYIIKNGTTWYWYDTQKKLSESRKWDFASDCKGYLPKDVYQHDASFAPSPDGSRLFVTVTCDEGMSRFYLVNTDGSGIKTLGSMTTPPSWQALESAWTSDGKFLILMGAVPNPPDQSAYMELYLFDIERMLSHPATGPTQITSDKASKQGAVWQPEP